MEAMGRLFKRGSCFCLPRQRREQGRQAGAIIAAIAEEAGASVNLIDVTKSPDGQPAPAGYGVGDYLDDLERLDPSAEAFEQLNALAVPFIPSAVFLCKGRRRPPTGS